ncbi:hypothetical protein BGZ83_007852 [Gryganskiella cystojenkinii]|nr:hypothetical protein BGZ83_007852 [Gryganskiella cystojenkinii]
MLLGMDRVTIEEWMDLYDPLWSRLPKLVLSGWHKYCSALVGPVQEREMIARLRNAQETEIYDLCLYSYPGSNIFIKMQQELIRRSPRLVRLSWQAAEIHWRELSVVKLLVENIVVHKQDFRRLEALTLTGDGLESQEDLRTVLEAMPSLRELDLNGSDFHLRSWSVLRDQVPSLLLKLTHLNLKRCPRLQGDIIQDILCSTLNLQVFKGPAVLDRNLKDDPRPWVCLGLKSLSLCLVVEAPEAQPHKNTRERQSDFMERLSSLVHLEDLDLFGCPLLMDETGHRSWSAESFLQLTLSSGLDRLASLKRLRNLTGSLDGFSLPWRREEAEFVLLHWRDLESLKRLQVNAEARKLLGPLLKDDDPTVILESVVPRGYGY